MQMTSELKTAKMNEKHEYEKKQMEDDIADVKAQIKKLHNEHTSLV